VVQEVPGSNLGPETILIEELRAFHQSLQANAGIVPYIWRCFGGIFCLHVQVVNGIVGNIVLEVPYGRDLLIKV
jgi:hypothetical protein